MNCIDEPHVLYKMFIKGQPDIPENTYWGKCVQRRYDNRHCLYELRAKNDPRLSNPTNDRIQAKIAEFGKRAIEWKAIHRDLTFDEVGVIQEAYIDNKDIWMNIQSGGYSDYTSSQDTKDKMSAIRKGVPKSEEFKAKISAIHTGVKKEWTAEWKLNFFNGIKGLGFLGKKHTDESKAKMSVAKKGNIHWTGRKHTDESKAKISASQIRRHELNK